MMKFAVSLVVLILMVLPGLGASFTVAWDPNPVSDNVTAYRLWVSSDQVNWILVKETPETQWTHTFTPSGDSLTVYYCVTALNAFGESPKSAVVSADLPRLPSAPANVRLTVN